MNPITNIQSSTLSPAAMTPKAAAPADGTVRLAVVLTPGEIAAAVPELAALATWSLPVDAVAETK